MNADWHVTVLDESLSCHVLHKFPVIIGTESTCDIRVDDPDVAPTHLQINGTAHWMQVLSISKEHALSVNGRETRKAIIKRAGKAAHVVIGSTHLLLSYGSPDAATIKHTLAAIGVSPTKWFFASEGQTVGPLTDAELAEAADSGRMKLDDLVWRENDTECIPARDVKDLFRLPPTLSNSTDAVAHPPQHGTPSGPTVTCPYCWHRFSSDGVLFIAGHPDMIGDHVLGPFEPQRFLPSRFTPDGLAIDAGGVACPDMACPRCHLHVPAALLTATPHFVSIVGAPASGKSYFLASSIWKLRTVLPQCFGLRFTDVDAQTNQWLNDYEEKLFLQTDPTALQGIVKTELQASHVYRTVTLNGMPVVLPLPCMFSLRASSDPTQAERCLVLYDNAGEHFQAGQDTASAPGTQHLAHSEGIVFFFDPSADPRFVPYLNETARANMTSAHAHRQDVLLIETITRVQRRLGLGSSTRYRKPFLVVISKADLFSHLLDLSVPPWTRLPDGRCALDLDQIATVSYWCRHMLTKTAPELVSTVESFADNVLYVPVSALGHAPGKEGVQPLRIAPQWVETPTLYILSRLGLVARTKAGDPNLPVAENVEHLNGAANLTVPGTSTRLEVPLVYSGHVLCCPITGTMFRVPDLANAPHL